MTAQLFLIAHSVRDEAAFDVAAKMECLTATATWRTKVLDASTVRT